MVQWATQAFRRRLRRWIGNERGTETVNFIGIALAMVCLINAIWLVFYGAGGRTLRGAVQAEVVRYADGFEGGLQTRGPSGNVPGPVHRAAVAQAHVTQADGTVVDGARADGALTVDDPGVDGQWSSVIPNADPALSAQQLSGVVPVARLSVAPPLVTQAAANRAAFPMLFRPTQAGQILVDPITHTPVTFDPLAATPFAFGPLFDTGPETGYILIEPAASIQVRMDIPNHQAVLTDPLLGQQALVDLIRGQTYIKDSAASQPRAVALEVLEQAGMIQMQYVPSIAHAEQHFIAAPVLWVTTLGQQEAKP